MAKSSKTTTHKFPATAKALKQDLPAAKAAAEATKVAKKAQAKKMSALDAAAKVLGEKGTSMTTNDLIDVMAKKGYWSSPNGATPAATSPASAWPFR